MAAVARGYREEKATREAPAVECLWEYHAAEDGVVNVLPDGRSDLVLGYRLNPAGAPMNLTLRVAGPTRAATRVDTPAGAGCVALRFRPGWASSVFGVGAATLRGRFIAADDLLPVATVRRLLRPARSVPELRERLRGFGSSQTHARPPGWLLRSLELLHAGDAQRSRSLAASVGTSERTLQRGYADRVGVSPGFFANTLRLHRAARLLCDGLASPAAVAVATGYADQPHLTRACRSLGGFTPARMKRVLLPGLPLGPVAGTFKTTAAAAWRLPR